VNHASVRFWRLLVALLAAVIAPTGPHPGTTSASAAVFTYDAPAIVGVDAHETADSLAAPAQNAGPREWSASPPSSARATSTTPLARSVATEAAAGGEQLALGSGRFTNAEFAPGDLEAHFAKHAGEWGAIGEDSYLARARSMLSSDPGGDLLGSVRANGDVLRFNVRTGEFAVGSSDGVIRTLFRPDAGLDYWLAQVGK
jgi:hypothetical protein